MKSMLLELNGVGVREISEANVSLSGQILFKKSRRWGYLI